MRKKFTDILATAGRTILSALFVLFSGAVVFGQLTVEPDIAGKWAASRATQNQESPFEGIMDICSEGKAVYTVRSNQLVIYMTVKQKMTRGGILVMDFYMDYADTGRGFWKFSFPKKGTRIMSAIWGAEYRLDAKMLQPSFTKKLRAKAGGGKDIFPRAFYKNTVSGAESCD